jgi:hypothetical protein
MTTTAGEARTDSRLLFLSINVGDGPLFQRFSSQVAALDLVQRYCTALARLKGELDRRQGGPAPRRGDRLVTVTPDRGNPLVLVRTEMASPWISVLADLAKGSQPIAYGVSGVFVLHRLMGMVMEWQNHRQALSERRSPTDSSEDRSVRELLGRHRRAIGVQLDVEGIEDVGRATRQLGDVIAAEMIEPDDPRAVGIG